MRPYSRSGLLVEMCEDCRGIFLDQGELERLIDAEGGGWPGIIQPFDLVGEPIATGIAPRLVRLSSAVECRSRRHR